MTIGRSGTALAGLLALCSWQIGCQPNSGGADPRQIPLRPTIVSQPEPRTIIRAESPTYIDVSVVQGEIAEISGQFTSPWKQPRTLKRIEGLCACTSATISPMLLNPGDSATVSLTYDSRGNTKKELRVLGVFDNDGREVFEELPIIFSVGTAAALVVEEWGVDMGNVGSAAFTSKVIPIRAASAVDAARIRFEGLSDRVNADIVEGTQSNGEFHYDLYVKYSPNHISQGKFVETFDMVVPELIGRDRRFKFRVVGEAAPPISVTPSRGFIGAVSSNVENETRFVLKAQQLITVNSIRAPAWLDARIDDKPSPANEIAVRVLTRLKAPPTEPAAGSIILEIETHLGNAPYTVSIPVLYATTD